MSAMGATALISFEWLQRPENILAGHLTWTDYRPLDHPNHVRIFHHKTGEKIWHPLEANGVRFYPELENFLAILERLGTPIVLLKPKKANQTPRPFRIQYADEL